VKTEVVWVELEELKTNNMARINGSGFKMKRTPVKGLADFFSSLGKQLKAGQKDRGIFSEKGKAEKKSRKAGESKFQADVRRRGEARKSDKTGEKAKKTINTNFVKDINSPTNTKPGELKVNKELMSNKVKKTTTPKTAKLTFKKAFAAARKAGKKTFTWEGNPYTTELAKTKNKPTVKTGPRAEKVKKKEINPKTIKQDIAPTPGPLDPKYIPKAGDKELNLKDFKGIIEPKNKNAGGNQSTYIGQPIIDPLMEQSMKLSGIRKKSPSKKRGYKMKKSK